VPFIVINFCFVDFVAAFLCLRVIVISVGGGSGGGGIDDITC
jgi:hypothetical protein